ncbi:MAG: STAS domain-containing protein [Candidatus Omnitrophota bacterium]
MRIIIDSAELYSRKVGGAAVISIHGSFLVGEVAKLQNLFNHHKHEGVQDFIVDLENTRLLQSHVIGQLLVIIQDITKSGGRICLVKPTERVRFVLNLTRVSELVPVYDSMQEAIEAFSLPAEGLET